MKNRLSNIIYVDKYKNVFEYEPQIYPKEISILQQNTIIYGVFVTERSSTESSNIR